MVKFNFRALRDQYFKFEAADINYQMHCSVLKALKAQLSILA